MLTLPSQFTSPHLTSPSSPLVVVPEVVDVVVVVSVVSVVVVVVVVSELLSPSGVTSGKS